LGAYGTPFWGRGGRRGSAMASFERAVVVRTLLAQPRPKDFAVLGGLIPSSRPYTEFPIGSPL